MEELEAIGVGSIMDIPNDFILTEIQRRAATCVQTGEPWYSPELRHVLGGLAYPLYFADFETVSPCIPKFPGTHPYQNVPFQWSVHMQRQAGAAPEHFEFLAADKSDPRAAFASALCDVLGDRGSIVVYHQQFESQRLTGLALWLPEFSGRIKRIQRRLWDLLPVVRNHVYHHGFGGSYSLKSVLPALVPQMTYAGIEVADGRAAGSAWNSLINGELNHDEAPRIWKALLAYCARDTFGMMALLEKLQHVSAEF
jgi:hypothetical protein